MFIHGRRPRIREWHCRKSDSRNRERALGIGDGRPRNLISGRIWATTLFRLAGEHAPCRRRVTGAKRGFGGRLESHISDGSFGNANDTKAMMFNPYPRTESAGENGSRRPTFQREILVAPRAEAADSAIARGRDSRSTFTRMPYGAAV
jgi:hypothetical protein